MAARQAGAIAMSSASAPLFRGVSGYILITSHPCGISVTFLTTTLNPEPWGGTVVVVAVAKRQLPHLPSGRSGCEEGRAAPRMLSPLPPRGPRGFRSTRGPFAASR